MRIRTLIALAALILFGWSAPPAAQAQPAMNTLSTAEARAIAKEAYIYGFPLVDNYRVMYSYFVDRGGKEFKASWNQIHNESRVYTPDDKAIQTPNSDTPYSQIGTDLRTEPLVITVPAVPKERYYSLQFIDLYTHNFAYVGSRATGNEAGSFLLAGPNWKGDKPAGVKAVIRSETEIGWVLFRTQLFNPGDIDAAKKVQAGYRVESLSRFLGNPAPAPAPVVTFILPLTPEQQRTSPEFFRILNFVLRFCPTHRSEQQLMTRFAKLGIGPGGTFDAAKLSPEMRKAVEAGMADAWKEFAEFKKTRIDTGKRTAADGFGTRSFLKNDYLVRMASAVLGIYGNSKEEALYPAYYNDADGAKLDASSNRYTLRFAPGQLPPVNAFWSLTMYELPSSLLAANSLNRYLINSTMLPDLKRDADGGLTLYLQHESPGKENESNWLPAPKGEFWAVLRLYWPQEVALNGKWKAPPLWRVGANASAGGPVTVENFVRAAPAEAAATLPAEAPASVPALGDSRFWVKTPDGKVIVTPDNFIRAESDVYMAGQVKDGAFGTFKHTRETAPVDKQLIVRLNRDTIYSSGIFDLDAGPVTFTLPESGNRFVSALVINEDHFNPNVYYGAGTYTLTKENVGTRYVMVAIRTLADPNDPEDMKQANAIQDAITVNQPGGPGKFEIPEWDPASQKRVREALIAVSNTLPDLRYAAGPDKASVDPIRRLAAAASGWGLNPDKDAIYLNVFPEKNDGKTPYRLTVGQVPVDAFWSITVYTAEGYFQPNNLNAYSINSITGRKNDDGSITINFGGCTPDSVNCLPVTPGWNYMVRLYRPQKVLLDGTWKFPEAQPAK